MSETDAKAQGHLGEEGKRLYAEDLVKSLGQRVGLGSYTVTEEEIRSFAGKWDPLQIHVGDGQHFNSVIASGLHTLAVFQRLAVDAAYGSWAVVAGRAVREVVFHRPVFPADTLKGWLRINRGHPARQGRAKFEVEGHLENQNGERVLSVHVDTYVHTRAEAADIVER